MEQKPENTQQIDAMNDIEEIIKKWVVMSKWKKDLEFYAELKDRMFNA